MNPLLTVEYFPTLAELPAAEVAAVRSILQQAWAAHLPGVDARPASVVGDSFLAGAAPMLRAVEVAAERLRSDLDPHQVGDGIIYSCEVVQKFLANFGVYDLGGISTTGYVLLTLSSMPEARVFELPRHLRFTTSQGGIELAIACPFPGNPAIVRPGEPLQEGANEFKASRTGGDAYIVLLPVYSAEYIVIPDATTLSLSESIDTITGAAAFAFSALPTTAGLPELARKTQLTAFAASPSTVGGIRRFADLYFPGVKGVSVANPGDPEQVRASISALGFPKPAADVFVLGKRAFREVVQTVKLRYNSAGQYFSGAFDPISTPQIFNGLTWDSDASIPLEPEIWMYCDNPSLPGALAAGSGDERYWVTVPMPLDGDGAERLSIIPDEEGGPYAWFDFSYLADDEVARFRATLRSPDWRMHGTDVIVMPFRVARIRALQVSYHRRAGTRMALEQARQEILADILGTVFPAVLSPAAWTESTAFAGASKVTAIQVSASLSWGIATHILPAGEDPAVDYPAADAAKLDLLEVALTSDTLADGFLDTDIGEVDSRYRVAGPRNMTWFILPEDITFVETL